MKDEMGGSWEQPVPEKMTLRQLLAIRGMLNRGEKLHGVTYSSGNVWFTDWNDNPCRITRDGEVQIQVQQWQTQYTYNEVRS